MTMPFALFSIETIGQVLEVVQFIVSGKFALTFGTNVFDRGRLKRSSFVRREETLLKVVVHCGSFLFIVVNKLLLTDGTRLFAQRSFRCSGWRWRSLVDGIEGQCGQ